MAKRSTRTAPPRSQANHTSTPASQSPAIPDRLSDTSTFGDRVDPTSAVQEDVDDPTRVVSMASEPPELSIPPATDEEQIRHRAYQRFLERGGSHGNDVNDWIEAEEELRNRR